MNKYTLILPVIAASVFLAGCVGTGPNTQQGAVSGGALGAIAGALIGANNGDPLGGAILGATAGAIAGGTLGNSVDNERGTLYGYPRRTYYQGPAQPPPPPQTSEAVPPSPAPNALWVPGYWAFDGYRYNWMAGHWEVPPPHATTYVVAHWEHRDGNYVYVQSHWR